MEARKKTCMKTRENNVEKGIFENAVKQRGDMHIAITRPVRSNQVDAQQVVAQNDAGNAVAGNGKGGEC